MYTRENSKGTVSISPFNQEKEEAIDDPAERKMKQKGDFIYKVDDMLAILFPHMFEDTEFLLPPNALEPSSSRNHGEDVVMVDDRQEDSRNSEHVNAVAGPSRLSYD